MSESKGKNSHKKINGGCKNDPELKIDASFECLMRDVTPLKQANKFEFSSHKVRNFFPQSTLDERKNNAYQTKKDKKILSDHEPPTIDPDTFINYAHPLISVKTQNKLKTGKIEPGYHLDLHGCSIKEASELLPEFFQFCKKKHIECVRIIHGKSYRNYNANKITMKSYLANWLRLYISDVVAFVSCPPYSGGTGAVYVLLKVNDKYGEYLS